jgi:hypothetical protein
MNNFETLKKVGEDNIDMLSHSLKETKTDLKKKIQDLKVAGVTALGPGVLSSIAMASKGAAGS